MHAPFVPHLPSVYSDSLQDPVQYDLLRIDYTTIDGEFFPRDPRAMSDDGEVNQVSVMIGCLDSEGTFFIMPKVLGQEGYDKPVLNRSVSDSSLSLFLGDVDDLVLDVIYMFYIDQEEVGCQGQIHHFHLGGAKDYVPARTKRARNQTHSRKGSSSRVVLILSRAI